MIKEAIPLTQLPIAPLPPQAKSYQSPTLNFRFCTLMICVTDAIHQLTLQTTRSIQFTADAIIDFNKIDLENATLTLAIGLLQSVSLVALGILGLFEPEFSRQVSQHKSLRYNNLSTKYCTPTIAKMLCAFHAATFFPCNIILGINTLVAAPFKGRGTECFNEATIYLCKAIIDLVAIPGGFFSEQFRQSECIQTINKG